MNTEKWETQTAVLNPVWVFRASVFKQMNPLYSLEKTPKKIDAMGLNWPKLLRVLKNLPHNPHGGKGNRVCSLWYLPGRNHWRGK